VIGPVVNLASQIEGLNKQLLRPVLVSCAFAQACPRPLVSLGFHPVRGLFEPGFGVFARPSATLDVGFGSN
jgi:adenylate cyclase